MSSCRCEWIYRQKLIKKNKIFENLISISRSNLENIKVKNLESYNFDISLGWKINSTADVLIFCATYHQFSSVEQSPIQYVNTNILGLINSLEYAKDHKIKQFIYFSSIAIYGSPKSKIINEESQINNPDLYGTSKYFAEKVLQRYANFFQILIIRLPGVVDKEMLTTRPWLSTAINNLRKNENINLYNQDCYFNNLIDIDNINNFIESLVKNKKIFKFEIVNLAASEPLKLIDLINLCKKKLDSQSIIINKKSDKVSFTIDIKKLINFFQFTPSTTKQIINDILL